jgi:hypothetical protein
MVSLRAQQRSFLYLSNGMKKVEGEILCARFHSICRNKPMLIA